MAREFHTNISMQSGAKITGLPAATATGEAVTYEQLNSAVEGLGWKDSVRVASTANVTLSGPGASIDGVTLANGDRVLLKNQTTQSQNGIYIFNGAAVTMTRATDASTFAELEGAVVNVEEGTANGGTQFRQTQVNGTIETDNVIWTNFGTAAPDASPTQKGLIEIATQAEVNTGTDTERAVTPDTLDGWSGRAWIKEFTIGDGSATSFNCDHNLNSRNVVVEVYKNSGNYDTIVADVTRPTANRVTVAFGTAPSSNAYKVAVIGLQA